MTMLIGQMLGCLFIAAGIGGAVGWLLRHLSASPLAQQVTDVSTTLQLKEQAMEKLRYELKAKVSAIQTLESKIIAAESLQQSTKQELAARHERIQSLQQELTAATQRLSTLESEQAAFLARMNDRDAATLAQAEELQQSKAALEAAQQTLSLKEQEMLPLQERFAILDNLLADTDRLRTRIQDLEPAQGRVHWLEVQLSERETQHRTALHEIERQLAERDRIIQELAPLPQQLIEHEALRKSWEAKYAQAIQRTTDEAARYQDLHTQLEALQAQLTLHEQRLSEKDDRIATLERHIGTFESAQKEMADQAKMVDEKEEEISRLRRRLVEVRAALRIRTDDGVAPRPIKPTDTQLSLQIGQPKPSPAQPKDDLKEIRGIGPAFERELNKLGIVSFQQVAQWDAPTLQQIADKLDTAPDRIKRDKWIARAKKLHEQKYGKRL